MNELLAKIDEGIQELIAIGTLLAGEAAEKATKLSKLASKLIRLMLALAAGMFVCAWFSHAAAVWVIPVVLMVGGGYAAWKITQPKVIEAIAAIEGATEILGNQNVSKTLKETKVAVGKLRAEIFKSIGWLCLLALYLILVPISNDQQYALALPFIIGAAIFVGNKKVRVVCGIVFFWITCFIWQGGTKAALKEHDEIVFKKFAQQQAVETRRQAEIEASLPKIVPGFNIVPAPGMNTTCAPGVKPIVDAFDRDDVKDGFAYTVPKGCYGVLVYPKPWARYELKTADPSSTGAISVACYNGKVNILPAPANGNWHISCGGRTEREKHTLLLQTNEPGGLKLNFTPQ